MEEQVYEKLLQSHAQSESVQEMCADLIRLNFYRSGDCALFKRSFARDGIVDPTEMCTNCKYYMPELQVCPRSPVLIRGLK